MLERNVWMAKLADNQRNFENYGDDEQSGKDLYQVLIGNIEKAM